MSATYTTSALPTMSLQAAPLQASSQHAASDDELLQLFRQVTISGSGAHDVSEKQIKKAFQQKISRPLGRQVLEASLRQANACRCYHWEYNDQINGNVTISRVKLDFKLNSSSMGQSVSGDAYGFFKATSGFINATIYYDNQQTLQGNQRVEVYMNDGNFIIDFKTTDQAEKPIARVVQTASSFTFQGVDTGDATWSTQ